MQELLSKIRSCEVCKADLPLGPRPMVVAHEKAKILIIGHAPGTKVHASGIPWDDQSGRRLRAWMGITTENFYDETKVAQMPMGFCYPGKGKSGDLPPRPECAPLWHELLLKQLKNIELTLLIGQYSQRHYLGKRMKKNLTETVKDYKQYLPKYLVLPHPSPRNRFWVTKNPWFEKEVLPMLQDTISSLLKP